MATGDLDVSLLLRIMTTMAERRAFNPQDVNSGLLAAMLFPDSDDQYLQHVERHLAFLVDAGYLAQVRAESKMMYASFKLTVKGQTFVQPELLEFGSKPLLPMVVKSLEDKINVLTYPEAEKSNMIYRLRDALAENAPDLIAKVIAEIGFKILGGR